MSPFDNRGFGGKPLNYSNIQNKIFLGGGGGSGHTDNNNGIDMKGGNGGGIVIIDANNILSNTFKILSKGDSGQICNNSTNNCHDGNGGGGSGGVILLSINNYLNNNITEVKGGKGADLVIYNGTNATKVGPGGGGGGGIVWIKQPTIPLNLNINATEGLNGVIIQNSNNPYGATPGQAGQTLFNLNLPITSILFKPSIDSVKITQTRTTCNSFNFSGLGYPSTNAITNWQWNFDDGTTASGQNVSHIFPNNNIYNVSLVITDTNGCKDSATSQVVIEPLVTTVTPNASICHNTNITLNATGGDSYVWSPATYLNNANIFNPTASPVNDIKYYVTITNSLGCVKTDSISINVILKPTFTIQANKTNICINDTVDLLATGGDEYLWTPSSSLDNNTIDNPYGIPLLTTNYFVRIVSSICNDTANLNKLITVNPKPIVTLTKSNDIDCVLSSTNLLATGATRYIWSPSLGLSNSNIANPIASIDSTTTFTILSSNNNCTSLDSIKVFVTKNNQPIFNMPNSFTPNGDGLNDCFGIRRLNLRGLDYFAVYNRWGQMVFKTNNPNICWDGRFNGVAQPTGVYIYTISGRSFCDSFKTHNTITLIR